MSMPWWFWFFPGGLVVFTVGWILLVNLTKRKEK